jgi:pyruvate dehydrogenase E2 component (dihydrolipoamide acetyltransferase)
LGIDINKVPGTGPNKRISLGDVKDYVKKLNEQRQSGGAGLNIKQESLPDFTKFGKVERKPMNKIRTKTADHLSYAWNTIPHVTQHDKADITELEKIRKQLNPKAEEAGTKLTVTGILVTIAVAALKKYPQFNTSIDMEKYEIIQKEYFNIGIAVDTENGLIVPVIKNADQKGLLEISIEMNSLAEKARSRKIGLDDLQGACFTITNLGGIGGTSFTPIVNSPEVAILGVSRGSYEPVYKDKQFVPRLMMPLSLSYDHRIIDGADAARFLRWVCETLEQPFNLIFE